MWDENCHIQSGTHSFGSVTIKSGVTAKIYNQVTLTFSSLIIESDARLDGTGTGYQQRNNSPECPPVTNEYHGGVHGGTDGRRQADSCGDYKQPTLMGSGGWHASDGGAALRITVSGTLTLNGVIIVNGSTVSHSGGAGGSIWATIGTLKGAGTFSALGGNHASHSNYAAGGGGRIAIYVSNNNDWTGLIRAAGGSGGSYTGAAGSIYIKKGSEEHYIVDNINRSTSRYHTLVSGYPFSNVASTSINIPNLTIKHKGLLRLAPAVNDGRTFSLTVDELLQDEGNKHSNTLQINNGGTLNLNLSNGLDYRLEGKIDMSNAASNEIEYHEEYIRNALLVSNINIALTAGAHLNLPTTAIFDSAYISFTDATHSPINHLILYGNSQFTYTDALAQNVQFTSMLITDQSYFHSKITDYSNTRTINISQKLTIRENGRFYIQQGHHTLNCPVINIYDTGHIDGDYRGYRYRHAHSSCQVVTGEYHGGDHGGQGGRHQGTKSCGDFKEPVLMGGGGYHSSYGGAAIKIVSTSQIFLDEEAKISVNGQTNTHSGGAGGSIWIVTPKLLGSGSIRANGGNHASHSNYGAGGGGRIAIYASTEMSEDLKISACGGSGGSYDGGAGTVYYEVGPASTSTLKMNNCERAQTTYTWIVEGNPTDATLSFDYLDVSGHAKFGIAPAIVNGTNSLYVDEILGTNRHVIHLWNGNHWTMDKSSDLTNVHIVSDMLTDYVNGNNVAVTYTKVKNSLFLQDLVMNTDVGSTLTVPTSLVTHSVTMNIRGELIGATHLVALEASILKYYNPPIGGVNSKFDDIYIADTSYIQFISESYSEDMVIDITNRLDITNTAGLYFKGAHATVNVDTVNVQINSNIGADSAGYRYRHAHSSCQVVTGEYHGGDHGGQGGRHQGTKSCGNFKEPVLMGGGGYHSSYGGGAIKIVAETEIHLDGKITVNGQTNTHSGGAGGSIWIITPKLTGDGHIRANGGNHASHSNYGAGGGGRIAIYADENPFFNEDTGKVTACGGSGGSYDGGAGTIYVESTYNNATIGHTSGYRTNHLVMDNCGYAQTTYTWIVEGNPTDVSLSFDFITANNHAKFGIAPAIANGNNRLYVDEILGTNRHVIHLWNGNHWTMDKSSDLTNVHIVSEMLTDYVNGNNIAVAYTKVKNSLFLQDLVMNTDVGSTLTVPTSLVTHSVTMNIRGELIGATHLVALEASILKYYNPPIGGVNSKFNDVYIGDTSYIQFISESYSGNMVIDITNRLDITDTAGLYFKGAHGTLNIDAINIQDSGVIGADNAGYRYRHAHSSCQVVTGEYHGGDHGGQGGRHQGSKSCGDFKEPVLMGGGGYHSSYGGGAIKIVAETEIKNYGFITVNGQKNTHSGGAGGSIWIVTPKLTGDGHIRANGGNHASHSNYGAGAGGRIAIYAGEYDINNLKVNACGGSGGSYDGGAGSQYYEIGTGNSTISTLRYDNCGYAETTLSYVYEGFPLAEDLYIDNLNITRGARVAFHPAHDDADNIITIDEIYGNRNGYLQLTKGSHLKTDTTKALDTEIFTYINEMEAEKDSYDFKIIENYVFKSLRLKDINIYVNVGAKFETPKAIFFLGTYLQIDGEILGADRLIIIHNSEFYLTSNAYDASVRNSNFRWNSIELADNAKFTLAAGGSSTSMYLNVTKHIELIDTSRINLPRKHLIINADTINILDTASIYGQGRGYTQRNAHSTCTRVNNEYHGGSHGGIGGRAADGSDCGDYRFPIIMGGGGYHSSDGGAAVQVNVRKLHIDGSINVNGETNTHSGAAGGSVWVDAKQLTGSGAIYANGGNHASHANYGAGGGGRIAVHTDASSDTVKLQACGGSGGSYDGAGGTVYTEIGKDPQNRRTTLKIDMCGRCSTISDCKATRIYADHDDYPAFHNIELVRKGALVFKRRNDATTRYLINIGHISGNGFLHINDGIDVIYGKFSSWYGSGIDNQVDVITDDNCNMKVSQTVKHTISTGAFTGGLGIKINTGSVIQIPKKLYLCGMHWYNEGGKVANVDEVVECTAGAHIHGDFIHVGAIGDTSTFKCAHPKAVNYDSTYTPPDDYNHGSCYFDPDDVVGCMYKDAINYNPDATIDDGNCDFPLI